MKIWKNIEHSWKRGRFQRAYKGLMEYISSLKSDLITKYPEYSASGWIYPGYMDMSLFPPVS